MAKFTPLYGNISGKLGANVFAHGKGGSYIRIFRPPTNPNSLAQQSARAAFGLNSKAWASLTSVQKGSWNSFASSIFSPKNPKPGVSYSGCAAYSSCLNQIASLSKVAGTFGEDLTLVTPVELTYVNYVAGISAPTSLFSALISPSDIAGESSFSLSAIALTVDDACELTFTTSESGVDVSAWTNFRYKGKANEENFGFAVYVERRAGGEGNSLGQIQPLLFGACKPITNELEFTEGTPAIGMGIKFSTSLNLADSKYPLAAGDVVLASVYAVSKSGNSVLIGSLETTLL